MISSISGSLKVWVFLRQLEGLGLLHAQHAAIEVERAVEIGDADADGGQVVR
jgi:hypothetical protein